MVFHWDVEIGRWQEKLKLAKMSGTINLLIISNMVAFTIKEGGIKKWKCEFQEWISKKSL